MSNKVKVTIYPLGNRIKYRIFGRMYCNRMMSEMPNSRTFDKRDGIWYSVFGSKRNIERFIHLNKPITRVVHPQILGYDSCDSTNIGSIQNVSNS